MKDIGNTIQSGNHSFGLDNQISVHTFFAFVEIWQISSQPILKPLAFDELQKT